MSVDWEFRFIAAIRWMFAEKVSDPFARLMVTTHAQQRLVNDLLPNRMGRTVERTTPMERSIVSENSFLHHPDIGAVQDQQDLGVIQGSIPGVDLQQRGLGIHRSLPPAVPIEPALPGFQQIIPGVVYGTHLANTKNHIIDGFRQVSADDGFQNLVGYSEISLPSDLNSLGIVLVHLCQKVTDLCKRSEPHFVATWLLFTFLWIHFRGFPMH